jgi:hypothetical protein
MARSIFASLLTLSLFGTGCTDEAALDIDSEELVGGKADGTSLPAGCTFTDQKDLSGIVGSYIRSRPVGAESGEVLSLNILSAVVQPGDPEFPRSTLYKGSYQGTAAGRGAESGQLFLTRDVFGGDSPQEAAQIMLAQGDVTVDLYEIYGITRTATQVTSLCVVRSVGFPGDNIFVLRRIR